MARDTRPGFLPSSLCSSVCLAGTTIPINTLELCPQPPGCHVRACGYKSRHPGGANFLMGDGSVHFIAETIDYRLFNELGTRAGGEPAKLPD